MAAKVSLELTKVLKTVLRTAAKMGHSLVQSLALTKVLKMALRMALKMARYLVSS
jgi:hypothetical protein